MNRICVNVLVCVFVGTDQSTNWLQRIEYLNETKGICIKITLKAFHIESYEYRICFCSKFKKRTFYRIRMWFFFLLFFSLHFCYLIYSDQFKINRHNRLQYRTDSVSLDFHWPTEYREENSLPFPWFDCLHSAKHLKQINRLSKRPIIHVHIYLL